MKYKVTVDYSLGLKKMIENCQCTYVNDDITEKNFKLSKDVSGVVTKEIKEFFDKFSVKEDEMFGWSRQDMDGAMQVAKFYRSKIIELLEEVKKVAPEKSHARLGSENQTVYVAYSDGFNDCRTKVLTNLNNLIESIKK